MANSVDGGKGGKEKSLQLCFLNEAVFEEEEEEGHSDNRELRDEDGKTSQNKENTFGGGEGADSLLPLHQRPSALFIAKNNISKKKNHVIIPLTPTPTSAKSKEVNEEAAAEVAGERERAGKRGGGKSRRRHRQRIDIDVHSLTEDTFALYLKEIKEEARERLRRVRDNDGPGHDGRRQVNGVVNREHARCFLNDLETLFGVKGSRKFTRQALTKMNLAQLQLILNFLLSRVEDLNEKLVRYLITRDELVMEQDSLLTDIEDITKGIGCSNPDF